MASLIQPLGKDWPESV